MATPIMELQAVQTYRVFIRASAGDVWDALTRPGWTQQYGYRMAAQYDLRPGGRYLAFATGPMRIRGAADLAAEGEVVYADPPRRLVHTWHPLLDADTITEGETRLTWEIAEDDGGGVSCLTVTHDLTGAPGTAALAAGAAPREQPGLRGGWAWVLSDLKSLLETGRPLAR